MESGSRKAGGTILPLACALSVSPAPHDFTRMTAARVIEEIDDLPPEEQAKVIQHALSLARTRQLSADEMGNWLIASR